MINKSEILKSAKDAYHKFMWIFIFKIYSNIVAQVNSELFKISCADPKKITGGSEGYFSLLGRSEASFLYEILLRKYKKL